ncbi:MAG: ParB/RepB/Spo0J family partition protein, partial [Sedimentisphaerales bacterium]|nr:ParB/RepB/Spo0J family partition protein [Sedimentisphaerales bacterium]
KDATMTKAPPYEKGNLYQISITDIKPDPDQPRKVIDPEALSELVTSIEKFGIIQPLLFRDAGEAGLFIVAGERRYQAAQQIGLTTLPAIFIEGNHAEIALIENLQRQDLTCVEEAEALQRLMVEQNFTQEQLGGIVGKARTTVRDILTLNRLPQRIRDDCRGDRTIFRQTLIDIARKKQERGMITAYNAYRLKQQKANESGGQSPNQPQKINSNDPAALLAFVQKAVMKIGNIDTSAWTNDETENLRAAFVDLKKQIDGFLNPKTLPDQTNS